MTACRPLFDQVMNFLGHVMSGQLGSKGHFGLKIVGLWTLCGFGGVDCAENCHMRHYFDFKDIKECH